MSLQSIVLMGGGGKVMMVQRENLEVRERELDFPAVERRGVDDGI